MPESGFLACRALLFYSNKETNPFLFFLNLHTVASCYLIFFFFWKVFGYTILEGTKIRLLERV